MLRTRRRMGRAMRRAAGQVTLSVVATLVATLLFAGLRHGYREIEPRIPADKVTARVEGGVLPAFEPEGPRLPLLSTLNWTPPAASAADWTGAGETPAAAHAVLRTATARPTHHPAAPALPAVAAEQPPSRPPAAAPLVPAAPDSRPLPVRVASSVLDELSAAADRMGAAVVDAAHGARAATGSVVARLMP